MVPLKEVEELLKKCANELGIDYEPELEECEEETNEKKQMKEMKEWFKASPNELTRKLNS